MRRAPSPGRSRPKEACSKWPTAAPSCSMRSASSRSISRPSSCTPSRPGRCVASAGPRRERSRCASSQPRTPTLANILGKTFRQDLYYRLNVVQIHLPPLRERNQDLPALCEHLLRTIAPGRKLRLADGEIVVSSNYAWPGNVRELRNVLERAVLVSTTGEVCPSLLIDDHRDLSALRTSRTGRTAADRDVAARRRNAGGHRRTRDKDAMQQHAGQPYPHGAGPRHIAFDVETPYQGVPFAMNRQAIQTGPN